MDLFISKKIKVLKALGLLILAHSLFAKFYENIITKEIVT